MHAGNNLQRFIHSMIALLVISATFILPSEAEAQGPLRRLLGRRNIQRPVQPVPRPPVQRQPVQRQPVQPASPVIQPMTTTQPPVQTPVRASNPVQSVTYRTADSQRGRLGIRISEVKTGLGVSVTYIEPDSPASKSGIEVGDRIVSVNGDPVTGTTQFVREVSSHSPGESIKVSIAAEQGVKTVSPILIGGKPPKPAPTKPTPAPTKPVQLQPIPDEAPSILQRNPATDEADKEEVDELAFGDGEPITTPLP